jgi:hypothetical protein
MVRLPLVRAVLPVPEKKKVQPPKIRLYLANPDVEPFWFDGFVS